MIENDDIYLSRPYIFDEGTLPDRIYPPVDMSKLKRVRKMDVYRIENASGNGPWHGGGRVSEEHCAPPAPQSDFGIMRDVDPHEKCGFHSLEQLLRWFPIKELYLLEAQGFRVRRYYGEVTAIGEWQLLFFPTRLEESYITMEWITKYINQKLHLTDQEQEYIRYNMYYNQRRNPYADSNTVAPQETTQRSETQSQA
jgi:hypothetical protein